jgi:hypothetical protein
LPKKEPSTEKNVPTKTKRKIMTIPQTTYVIDNQGQKVFVQLTIQDWENFLAEFRRIENMLLLKNKLKTAFREIRQIQQGEKKGTTLKDFLDEL